MGGGGHIPAAQPPGGGGTTTTTRYPVFPGSASGAPTLGCGPARAHAQEAKRIPFRERLRHPPHSITHTHITRCGGGPQHCWESVLARKEGWGRMHEHMNVPRDQGKLVLLQDGPGVWC